MTHHQQNWLKDTDESSVLSHRAALRTIECCLSCFASKEDVEDITVRRTVTWRYRNWRKLVHFLRNYVITYTGSLFGCMRIILVMSQIFVLCGVIWLSIWICELKDSVTDWRAQITHTHNTHTCPLLLLKVNSLKYILLSFILIFIFLSSIHSAVQIL